MDDVSPLAQLRSSLEWMQSSLERTEKRITEYEDGLSDLRNNRAVYRKALERTRDAIALLEQSEGMDEPLPVS